jgi:CheY-like chemotaxis protein
VASEKILLVDDDSDVRDIVGSVLSELGYDVHRVSNGAEALARLAEFTPDLLVVDFAMPGMNGAELVMAARRRNSRLKILFLSGYADSESLETAVGATPLLRKPFRPIELAAAVRAALDAQSPSADRLGVGERPAFAAMAKEP